MGGSWKPCESMDAWLFLFLLFSQSYELVFITYFNWYEMLIGFFPFNFFKLVFTWFKYLNGEWGIYFAFLLIVLQISKHYRLGEFKSWYVRKNAAISGQQTNKFSSDLS